MRFLRILPAVWAITSWSFSSFTRKVALGSNSTTVALNSSSLLLPYVSLSFDAGEWSEYAEKSSLFDLSAHLQHADQREQTPRRIFVNIGLTGKARP